MPYAELVFFAIQAAVQLIGTTRKIYVEKIADIGIPAPVPLVLDDPVVRAADFGEWLKASDPARSNVYAAADKTADAAARRSELLGLFTEDLVEGKTGAFFQTADPVELQQMAGRLAVADWMAGTSPAPAPLQRIAGVLIEIGVEYFANVPGALNENTQNGKAVKAFLTGLEKFDFQSERWDAIVIGLFSTALDTIKDHPELLPQDDVQHKYIANFLEGMATAMNAKMAAPPPAGEIDALDNMKNYSQMLLRCVLQSAGDAALDTPGLVNIPKAGVEELVHQVGASILDLLLSDTGPGGAFDVSAALRRTLSSETAGKLLEAGLKVASEHPDIFGASNTVVQKWIKDVAAGLYGGVEAHTLAFNSDLMPEVLAMVMKTALADLPGLLPANGAAGVPGLLVQVARTVFEKIAVDNGRGGVTWKFALSQSDVRGLFDTVLKAVGEHPEWYIKRPEDRARVAALVGAAIDVLTASPTFRLKDLLTTENFDKFFSAVLSSGLADALLKQTAKVGITPEMLSKAVDETVKAVAAKGTAGIAGVLKSGAMTDLLSAVAQSKTFVKLFNNDTVVLAAAAIGEAVALLRAEQIVSIPVLVETLDGK